MTRLDTKNNSDNTFVHQLAQCISKGDLKSIKDFFETKMVKLTPNLVSDLSELVSENNMLKLVKFIHFEGSLAERLILISLKYAWDRIYHQLIYFNKIEIDKQLISSYDGIINYKMCKKLHYQGIKVPITTSVYMCIVDSDLSQWRIVLDNFRLIDRRTIILILKKLNRDQKYCSSLYYWLLLNSDLTIWQLVIKEVIPRVNRSISKLMTKYGSAELINYCLAVKYIRLNHEKSIDIINRADNSIIWVTNLSFAFKWIIENKVPIQSDLNYDKLVLYYHVFTVYSQTRLDESLIPSILTALFETRRLSLLQHLLLSEPCFEAVKVRIRSIYLLGRLELYSDVLAAIKPIYYTRWYEINALLH